ncbi:MAG: class I SAM-dependent methyltransferase [Candidatus Latescibacteria bacterium]|nr:class I SAM-dependent methyltransferase [Candidatus Latescibacterota bacterium]
MQRRFRDKGWMETQQIIKSGIDHGLVLEIGPGPGYLGLEWLKNTNGTQLRGLDISPDMINRARHNTQEYNLESRVEYVESDSKTMPFADSMFDGVFSNGSLHEWSDPKDVSNEISRVLKPGGKYFISDLRRDIHPFVVWFMKVMTKPKEIKPGLITSINAAYTVDEITEILKESHLKNFTVGKDVMGLQITGFKS